MHRILIADSLGQAGIDLLRESGAEVDLLDDTTRPRLLAIIGDYDALIVRSATQVDEPLLRAGKRLKVVGRAGIGIDNIDLNTATELGILVINAPTSNLVSATEHTFALLLSLARRVPKADAALKKGVWDRKSFVGDELQGKTLGVIGFGQIGQRVAARARAFEMKVVAYDPFLNPEVARRLEVETATLDELLPRAEVLTFHTPLTDETRGLLNAERISKLPDGALVINCGRGGVIDEPALLAALESGKVGGAGLDVYSKEPLEDFALVKHPNVVATPHLGASTHEAQERVATDTAETILAVLGGSMAVPAVNLPFRAAGKAGEPYLNLGERLGRVASAMLGGGVRRVDVSLWGVEDGLCAPITVAALRGSLIPFLGEGVNYVNAERLAGERGIEVVRSTHSQAADYTHLVSVRLSGDEGEVEVAGTLYADGTPRVVRFQGFQLEFKPEGRLLVVRNRDVPGVVGQLGTAVGAAGINIAEIHLAREGSDNALAVLRLDEAPTESLLAGLQALDVVQSTQFVDLAG